MTNVDYELIRKLQKEATEERIKEANENWEQFKKEFQLSNGKVKMTENGFVLSSKSK